MMSEQEYTEGDKSVSELYEELKSHPAFMTEYDESLPLSEALEGLQALKYQSDDCDDNARSYKEDGNKNFEHGKYRWAIDCYTEGIKCKPSDDIMIAILYANRAAANFHLGNFRSALNDCIVARKFKPDHLKAIVRGAMSHLELKQFSDAVVWCDEALQVSPDDKKILDLRAKTGKLQRESEADKRRQLAEKRKEDRQSRRIIDAIQQRGIEFAEDCEPSACCQGLDMFDGTRVELTDDGCLLWPVLFLYPEYSETDFVRSFSEASTFLDHLEVMFGTDRPAWDVDNKYDPNVLQIYFEDRNCQKLYEVDVNSSLLRTLQHEKYRISNGLPTFIIVVRDSKFAKHFTAKYS